ncbi:MAG TPA: hypothetical protein VL172_03000 [Kofleriaceae bacterium]|nr:hypothetical protein [Kofleriaceae bacterium]
MILALGGGLAQAKKRLVVFAFSGPGAESFQGDVENLLRRKHTLVSQDSYVKRARKLNAGKPTAANVRKVAGDMSVDGMIIGTVKKTGPRYTVTVKVRAGADGAFSDPIVVHTRKPGLSGDAHKQMKADLLAEVTALPPLQPGGAASDDDDDDSGGGDDDDGGGGDDDSTRAAPPPVDGDSKPAPAPEVGITAERRADLLARGRGLDVAAGLSFMGRRLTFTVRSGLGDLSPRGYQGTPVAGAYVAGELYPLAFNLNNRSITRDLGITGVVDKVLKIESRLRYQDDANMEQVASLPTEQMRWGVGLVFRHNFGSRPTAPSVKLGIRYNRARFVIDKGAAPVVGGSAVVVDIPNMDYAYIDPGIAGRLPIGGKLSLLADVRYLYITDTGEMQQMDQYGDATVTGIDADVGAEYKISPQLSIRGGGRLIRIGYDFTEGNGAELVYNRDGDAASQDVFGAQDRYLGGYAIAAYLF